MAGGTGSSYPQQRKTERSRRGSPVVHIVIVCGLWQGASYSGAHPVFCFTLNLLTRDSQLLSSDIPSDPHLESALHTPAGHCR